MEIQLPLPLDRELPKPSYYNTVGLTGEKLKERKLRANSLAHEVLHIFAYNPQVAFTAWEVYDKIQGNRPVTSVRRAISESFMREIKFRALVLDDDDNARLEDNVSLIGDKVLTEDGFYMRYKEVMQYVGLKDKNGKEIYEGDIIEWTHLSRSSCIVYWNNDECVYCGKPIDPDEKTESWLDKNCIIIGNIYEHKHLLQ